MRHSCTIVFLCLIAGSGALAALGQQDTWTDPATGLTWTGRDNGNDVTWQQAQDYCRNLQFAGYSNWRLPTADELQGIYDASADQHGVCCNDKHQVDYHVKGNLRLSEGGIDWSSSPGTVPGEKMSYIFSFNVGVSGSNPVETTARRALCVRNVPTSEDTAQTSAHTESPANLSTQPEDFSNFPLATLQQRATAGDPGAQYQLGFRYQASGANQNYAQAAVWLGKAAYQGNAMAQLLLGLLHTLGKGVPQDYSKAAILFRQAADQGNATAEDALGVSYENGLGVLKDYSQAAAWYRKAAEQGVVHAQYSLGMVYFSGLGTAKDYQQAMYWFQKAAAQNSAIARFALGVMYEAGMGTAPDYEQAIPLYRVAAAQGVVGAQNNLGTCYLLGDGTTQDYAQAMYWIQKAAAQGDAGAQFNLGAMYSHGW